MEMRQFGKTDMRINPLGFGGMELRKADVQQADALLNLALDSGINYFDTSPEYPTSEEKIGHAISGRRGEFYLATKCGDTLQSDVPYRFDRATCMKNLDDSLRLLKTDYLDVWQLHAVMPELIAGGPGDDVIQYMEEVKKSGKVRYIGCTIRNGRGTEDRYPARFSYDAIEEFKNWGCFDVIQLVYGGMTRICEDRINDLANSGVGVIARGVVKNYRDWYNEKFEASGVSDLFESGETKHQFLLRYALTHPSLSGVVVGTKDPAHLLANCQAAEKGKLSAEVYEEAKRRFDRVGIVVGE